MKFDRGIDKIYRQAVEDAFATILETGNDLHRHIMNEILESKMLIRIKPVAKINASGVTGIINSVKTNYKLATERMSLREALGEVYIAIATETIGDGTIPRGCVGTLVHEGRHAYDFAQTLESLSNADMNPIGIFNPTLYELEWEAHKAAGDFMLCMNKQDYLDEGVQLMILGQDGGGSHYVSDDGIKQRLRDSYGLAADGNQGSLASQMLGIVV